jgi:hypothetical protein
MMLKRLLILNSVYKEQTELTTFDKKVNWYCERIQLPS